jgi:two-component system chemotaxis response regulator CheB
MATRDIVVIGASSDGIDALNKLVAPLPSELSAAIFVVQHLASSSMNDLPNILARHTSLGAQLATDGERFQRGRIYVAPADHHLFIDSDQMFLSQGPRENRVRPAIDPLFRSAALAHGARAIGVILSGSLDDGTAGLMAIKNAGGLAMVQDPSDALTPEMPQSALDYVEVDYRLTASELGALLGRLVAQPLPTASDEAPETTDRAALEREVGIIRDESGVINTADQLGRQVPASCPECGGPLWEVDGEMPRFRCHTGHAFTGRHLAAGLQEAEETSLWAALRVMEERARMLRRLAKKDEDRGYRLDHESFAAKAKEAEQHVNQLRNFLSARSLAHSADPAN